MLQYSRYYSNNQNDDVKINHGNGLFFILWYLRDFQHKNIGTEHYEMIYGIPCVL